MTMPFGKYRGMAVDALPDAYLRWLITIELYPTLRRAVERALLSRELDEDQRPAAGPDLSIRIAPDQVVLIRRVLDAGYRATARHLHPDAGGDADQMRELNQLVEDVRSQLRESEESA